MSVSSLSNGGLLPFASRPLALAAAVSVFLHTALVMAFVLTPDAIRVPEPPKLTEISIGPQIAPASDVPAPQPVPLAEAKPPELTAQDQEDQPVRPNGVIERQASLPDIAEPPLPPAPAAEASPLPEIAPSASTPAAAPAPAETIQGVEAQSVGVQGVQLGEVKPAAPDAPVTPSINAPATVGSITPPALASAPSSQLGLAEARPDDAQPVAPDLAAPLFPPETQAGAAAPAGDSLSLPVISSDDGLSSAAEVASQALNPADLPSVSDSGPDGEAAKSDAGSLKNAGRARPFLPPKRSTPQPQGGQPSQSASRGGRSDVYDPGVRVRYSSNLFAHLRRRLAFPTDGPSGTTTVRFVLDRSGQILQSGVVGSSGSPQLDAQALEIVQRAAPFPRFPEGFGSSQLEVTLPVTFKGQ